MAAGDDVEGALRITLPSTLDELRALSAFFDQLWGRRTPALPLELLRALTAAGNYTAAAYTGEQLVGGLSGFLGRHGAQTILHSHILGVAVPAQRRGVGLALKHHQRAWARDLGIATITWTFDPLVARNARFNLRRLGARATAYLPDFYGPMDDGFNASSPTDRLLVSWDTREAAPAAAAAVQPGEAVWALRAGDHGEPVTGPWGASLRVQVPSDVVALRRDDPELARSWSLAVRATLGAALEDGYTVEGVDADGVYVLAAPGLAGGR